MSEETIPAAPKPRLVISKGTGLTPTNFEEAYRMADALSKSGAVPDCYKNNAAGVLATMQLAWEMGVGAMTLLSWTFPLRGRICCWGDVAKGMVLSSGLVEDYKEWIDGETAICSIKRKGMPSPIERRFSLTDAKTAGLSHKDTYKQYGLRMCANRARTWALRDGFADVLCGLQVQDEFIDDAPPGRRVVVAEPDPAMEATA